MTKGGEAYVSTMWGGLPLGIIYRPERVGEGDKKGTPLSLTVIHGRANHGSINSFAVLIVAVSLYWQ